MDPGTASPGLPSPVDASDAASSAQPPLALWMRFPELSRWRNSFFAGRLVAMTLFSGLCLLMLIIVADESWLLVFWVAFQSPSILLGLAAFPTFPLYSIMTVGEESTTRSSVAAVSADSSSENNSPRLSAEHLSTYGSISFAGRTCFTTTTVLKRAFVLYICEGAIVVQTFVLTYVVVFLVVSFWVGEHFFDIFNSMFSTTAIAWLVTTVSFMMQTRDFDRLRGHEQLQLGAGLDEADLPSNYSIKPLAVPALQLPQGGDMVRVISATSGPQQVSVDGSITGFASSHNLLLSATAKELESELRTGLYEAAVLGDHARAEHLLAHAERFLGSKVHLQLLMLKIYSTPMLVCWAFARSTRNPLHVACRLGDVRMVEILLAAGMNPNFLDQIAGTNLDLQMLYEICQMRFKNIPHVLGAPIHVAVLNGHTKVIDVLAKHRANLDVIARSSFFSQSMRVTPVFLADAVDVLECLIHHKANILVVPGKGNAMSTTVLQRALLNHRRELASLLEEWGGDVALTPLHEAAAAGDLATVRHLLSWDVDPDVLGEYQTGVNRRTPLHWAAVMGRRANITELVGHRANVNAVDSAGRTPLHWATRHNHAQAVEELLALGADATLLDDDGLSPLAFGVIGGILGGTCVELFVRFGVNVDTRTFNEYGDTCLHMALRLGFRDVALALLENGNADLFCLNEVGQRAVECCASAELQYAVKVAGNCMDVVLSFDPAYRGFARRVRRGIEENFITVYMRGPGDDGSKSMEMMKNASAVVCVLSKDYESSTICMEELAFAKQNEVPVVAISCESVTMSEELQVYLYTRQIVPFLHAVTSSHTIMSTGSSHSLDDVDVDPVEFEIDEEKFQASLRNLIDGLRDEVELRRLGGNRSSPFETSSITASQGGVLLPSYRSSFPSGLTSSINLSPQSAQALVDRRTMNDVVSAVLAQSAFTAGHSKRQLTPSIFLSHGDCHREFVSKLYTELRRQHLRVTVDSMTKVSSMKARILAAKDAILQCSVFLVVLSENSAKTELVSDQLAFAEDKGKTIVPIYFTKKPRVLDATVSQLLEQQQRLFVFADDTSYGRGFDELVQELQRQELRQTSSASLVGNSVAQSAAQFFLRKARQSTAAKQPASPLAPVAV